MKTKKIQKCLCRPPKRHRDCAYCGIGYIDGAHMCGVCKEAGIDGPTIRGTGRVVCKLHKKGKNTTMVSVLSTDEWNKLFKKHKITARKYGGDDYASWAVFLNGRPKMEGLTKSEVNHYKKEVYKNFVKKD